MAVVGSAAATLFTMTIGAYAANLVNNGGPVQSAPKVYLVWWGQQWATGWTDAVVAPDLTVHTYKSSDAQRYITDFVKLGAGYGSVTQYGAGIPAYANSWVDTTSTPPPPLVPDNCVVLVCLLPGSTVDVANLMAQEAIRAEAHFGVANSVNNNFVIMLPKASITVGTGYYCAYHSEAKDGAGKKLSWTNMPYLPDIQGTFLVADCGENFVNHTDNAYGNGYFDGYSMVLGHEIAETATDPYPFTAPAWRDPSGQENGDLCAWQPSAHNVGPDANGHVFAVQAYWSNSAGGCV